MGASLKKMIGRLPREDQDKVKQKTAHLIKEEMSLQEIRKLMSMTQQEMADRLHINQDGISKLEKRSDIMLSTLRKYVSAAGGEVDLVIRLPNQPPINLSGFCDLNESSASGARKVG